MSDKENMQLEKQILDKVNSLRLKNEIIKGVVSDKDENCYISAKMIADFYKIGFSNAEKLVKRSLGVNDDFFGINGEYIESFDENNKKRYINIEIIDLKKEIILNKKRDLNSIIINNDKEKCNIPLNEKGKIICDGFNIAFDEISNVLHLDKSQFKANCIVKTENEGKEIVTSVKSGIRRTTI